MAVASNLDDVSNAIEASPSGTSLRSLDAVNLLLAGALSGFGPYVAVFLAEQKWTQQNIGFVLTAAGFVGLLTQLPAGGLLDAVRSKRNLVALGAVMVAAGALIIAFWPSFPLVLAALVLQGITGGFLGLAIAAISLGLVGHAALGERLGRNQRFASTGGVLAAGLMGLIGYFLSYRAIFLAAAALVVPLLFALGHIQPSDIHFGRACGAPDHHGPDAHPLEPSVEIARRYRPDDEPHPGKATPVCAAPDLPSTRPATPNWQSRARPCRPRPIAR
jgi:MFS family permease